MLIGGFWAGILWTQPTLSAQDAIRRDEPMNVIPAAPKLPAVPDGGGHVDFKAVMERMKGEKLAIQKRHAELLAKRYILDDLPAADFTILNYLKVF